MDPDINSFLYFFQSIYSHLNDISLRKFRSLTGVHFYTAAILYIYASSYDITISPIYIMWFLYWIKVYASEDACCLMWKCDNKTFCKYIHKVIIALFISLDTISFQFILFLLYYMIVYLIISIYLLLITVQESFLLC